MHDSPTRFQEVERILKENEQLHRRAGSLEVENHRLAEDLQAATLKLEWIAAIARDRPQPSRE
jgi:hypothetical protein